MAKGKKSADSAAQPFNSRREDQRESTTNDAQNASFNHNHQRVGIGTGLHCGPKSGTPTSPGLRLPGRVQSRVWERRQDLFQRLRGKLQRQISKGNLNRDVNQDKES